MDVKSERTGPELSKFGFTCLGNQLLTKLQQEQNPIQKSTLCASTLAACETSSRTPKSRKQRSRPKTRFQVVNPKTLEVNYPFQIGFLSLKHAETPFLAIREGFSTCQVHILKTLKFFLGCLWTLNETQSSWIFNPLRTFIKPGSSMGLMLLFLGYIFGRFPHTCPFLGTF